MDLIGNFLLVLCFTGVFCQLPLGGEKCPDFKCCIEVEEITLEDISGYWFVYAAVPFFYDANAKCLDVNVTIVNGNYFYYTSNRFDTVEERIRTFYGFGKFNEVGEFNGYFSDVKIPFNFKLIAMTNDFIIFSQCSECGVFSTGGIYIYVYTRQRHPSNEIKDEIFTKLENCGIARNLVPQQEQSLDFCEPCVDENANFYQV